MADDWKDFEIGAEVDVAEIMKRIRERIESKQKQGVYSEDAIAELADARLLQFAEEAEIDSALLERLLSREAHWNISPSYIITTHRQGWNARFIVFLKKAVRPFIRLYTDQIIGRQAQINLFFSHLVHNLVKELTRLQIQQTNLAGRIDRIEREKDFLERRVKTLEKMTSIPESPTDSNGSVHK